MKNLLVFLKFIIIVCIGFSISNLKAQEIGDIVIGLGKINCPVSASPSDYDGLKTFLKQMISQSSTAYTDGDKASFTLNTQIDYLYEKDIDINGTPMKVAELQFNFTLSTKYNNLSFESFSISIKESGESSKLLLRNSFKGLNSKKIAFQKFLSDSKTNMKQYFQAHCDEIIINGEHLLQKEEFDECIIILGQIPIEVTCSLRSRELLMKAYNAKLSKNCDIAISEIKTLIHQESFSDAYDKIMVLPINSKCIAKVDKILDEMDFAVCEKYILAAESFYANGNFNKCIQVLTEITKISKNCSDRKQSLENKIRKSLDANAKKQWDFKIKKYEDDIAAKKLDAVNNHEYAMKKMQTDATIKAKELAISVDLEKYKTQREIEFSKNNAIVEKVRLKEVGKMYSAYFNMVGEVVKSNSR